MPDANAASNLSQRRPRVYLWTVTSLLVLASLVLSACFVDLLNQRLVGPYRLFALENMEQVSIDYDLANNGGVGRVPAVIVDVGWDSRYVVATRRSPGDRDGELTYFYIDMAKDRPGAAPDGAVMGPLTVQEFAAAKSALGLPEFSLHYPRFR